MCVYIHMCVYIYTHNTTSYHMLKLLKACVINIVHYNRTGL